MLPVGEMGKESVGSLCILTTACESTVIQISIKGIYFWCQSWASGLLPCAHGCPGLHGEPPLPSSHLQTQMCLTHQGCSSKVGWETKWMHEWMGEWRDAWMNVWMHEWIWMNAWVDVAAGFFPFFRGLLFLSKPFRLTLCHKRALLICSVSLCLCFLKTLFLEKKVKKKRSL